MFKKILLYFANSSITPPLRNKLLNHIIGNVSISAEIRSGCYFTGNKIRIGERVFINKFCRFFLIVRKNQKSLLGTM